MAPSSPNSFSLKKIIQFLLVSGLGWAALTGAERPNIVVILADDLGYGDLRSYNPQSRIPTPNLDRLAAQGMRFVDAHTPSALCTPTRYALLTGRYAWRTPLKRGVLDGFDPPLIEATRETLAGFLRRQGYATAIIGKWHLGMNWQTRDGSAMPARGAQGGSRPGDEVDFARTLSGGPLDRGFDYFFGISASLDMSPYGFIEGRRMVMQPTSRLPNRINDFVLQQNAGVVSPGFMLEEVLPALRQRAESYVEARARERKPFFLLWALTSPHVPIVPSKEWRGATGAGAYADFVAQTDAEVGAFLSSIDRSAISESTLVIFTSDNGSAFHAWEPQEHDDKLGYKPRPHGLFNAAYGHQSNGELRGIKGDIYEGGSRVPFIVRWPGKVEAASISPALVDLTDLFATLTELVDGALPTASAEDSFSFLPALLGSAPRSAARTFAIHDSGSGVFALREGPWKLIPTRGSGGRSTPVTIEPAAGEPAGQLYNLAERLHETPNLWSRHPDIVSRMSEKLAHLLAGERTRP